MSICSPRIGIFLGAFEVDLAFQAGRHQHLGAGGFCLSQPVHLDAFTHLTAGAPAACAAAQAGVARAFHLPKL